MSGVYKLVDDGGKVVPIESSSNAVAVDEQRARAQVLATQARKAFREPAIALLEDLGKRQAQRAQIDLDVPQRPVAEFRCQRPMGRPYNQRGIYCNQEDGRDDSLGTEPQLQRRQELSNGSRIHNEESPKIGAQSELFCLRSH